jgi:large subunit ribosomal protein L23
MTEERQTQTSIPSNDEKKNGDYKKTYSLKSMIDLVKYPVLTEKTSIVLTKNRQYTFDVDKRLTKTQIKKLFETLFEVNVIGVNTHIPPRKTVRVGLARGFRPSYKRAIITLKENQTLNYNLNFVARSEGSAV